MLDTTYNTPDFSFIADRAIEYKARDTLYLRHRGGMVAKRDKYLENVRQYKANRVQKICSSLMLFASPLVFAGSVWIANDKSNDAKEPDQVVEMAKVGLKNAVDDELWKSAFNIQQTIDGNQQEARELRREMWAAFGVAAGSLVGLCESKRRRDEAADAQYANRYNIAVLRDEMTVNWRPTEVINKPPVPWALMLENHAMSASFPAPK